MDPRTEPLALLTYPVGGLAHYAAHLWEYLVRFARPICVTWASPEADELAPFPRSSIEKVFDPTCPETIEAAQRYFLKNDMRLLNVHVATFVIRHLSYFRCLLSVLRARGVRMVLTLHNVLPHVYFPVDPGELRELYNLGHGYLVGNEAQRRLLCDHFDVAGRPLAIAPHGPYTLLDQDRCDRAAARRLLGLRPDARLVLFFGRLRLDKGLDCLVHAWPRLRERLPDAELFIHTSNPFHADQDSWLAELAGRGQGIHVRNQFVSRAEIEPIFKAADVVALPYAMVTQSGVLNLAKAFQRPVVVTDIFDGAAAIDRTYGRSVPVNNLVALADALADLLSRSEEERRAMGALALRLALDHESWAHHAAALESVCRQARLG